MAARIALAVAITLVMAQAAQAKPNIVVLMTDDQTLESMSVMPKTRELLGERGTAFTRSFASYALCCPSRATLFTGQYTHNHGVLGNRPPFGGYTRLDRTNWLPLWLRSAGYRTMQVGKFLNGYGRDAPPTEVPLGFDDWHATVDPSTYSFYGYTLNENGILHTYGAAREPDFYSTDFLARRASELIAGAAPSAEPFFLSVAFLAPHSGGPRDVDDPAGIPTPVPAPRHTNAFAGAPVPPSPAFNEADMSDKPALMRNRPPIGAGRAAAIQETYQQRLESLLAVDDAVETIVAALGATGEVEDTLILFTSDNGFFHGEHRVPTGKVLVYEPSIRLPLYMRGPGVPKGGVRRQLVTNADLAPTILDAAGASPGRVQDGRSLFGLLEDPGVQWGRELLIEGASGQGVTFTALRNYRWKYVEHSTGETELYDLVRDPHELVSLHADPAHAAIRARLASRLGDLRACAGTSCRAKPALQIAVRRRGCRFVAAVRGAEVGAVERVSFGVVRRSARAAVGTRPAALDTRAPFRSGLRPRAVRPGQPVVVRAKVRLDDGRSVTLDRRRRACA